MLNLDKYLNSNFKSFSLFFATIEFRLNFQFLKLPLLNFLKFSFAIVFFLHSATFSKSDRNFRPDMFGLKVHVDTDFT